MKVIILGAGQGKRLLPLTAEVPKALLDIGGRSLIGRQIEWWDEGGWLAGYLFLLPDGSAGITVDRPQRSGDIGRWVLRQGLLCTVWGELRQGDEKCYSVEKTVDGRFRTSGGNVFEIDETGV